jgi:hypothetical protein
VLAGWFCAFALLGATFPRSGDDWAWGSQEGLQRLRDGFAGYNGRYAGDLLVLALTRASFVTPLVVAAVVTLTAFLLVLVARHRSPLGYATVALLYVAMPLGTWREAVAWLSGFSNYAFAGVVLLAFAALTASEWRGDLPRPGIAGPAGIAVAAFVGELFMEHVSLALVAASIASAVLFRRLRGRWPRRGVAWAVGAVAGAALMFSNSVYRPAVTGANYQKMPSAGTLADPTKLAGKLLDLISYDAVVVNTVLDLALAVVLGVLVARRPQARWARPLVLLLTAAWLTVCALLTVLSVQHAHPPLAVRALAGVAAALQLASLCVAALWLVRDRSTRFLVLGCCVGVLLMVAPLVMVEPLGPRAFYPTYLLLIVVVLALSREALDGVTAPRAAGLAVPLALVAAAVFGGYLVIYGTVARAEEQRVTALQRAVAEGRTAATIHPLPFGRFVHGGDPFWALYYTRFKVYYGLPTSLHIRLRPQAAVRRQSASGPRGAWPF